MVKNLKPNADQLREAISQAFEGICFKVDEYYRHGIAELLLFWQGGPEEIDVKRYLNSHGYPVTGPIKVIYHHGEYVNTHYGYVPATGKPEREHKTRRELQPTHKTQIPLHPIDAMTRARLEQSRRLQDSLRRPQTNRRRTRAFVARIIRVSREQMEMFGSGENKVKYQARLYL
ncbi:MAG: hypothetical protein WCH46_05505 [bacterium]